MFGSYALFYKKMIFVDQPITEIMRLINARQSEIDYTDSQFGSNWKYCDFKVRNVFRSVMSASMLKCIAGFNYHKKQSKIFNK